MKNKTPYPDPKVNSITPKYGNFEVTSPNYEDHEHKNPKPEKFYSENPITRNPKSKKESITAKPIYPCCCGVNQKSYFFVFTILLIINYSFALIRQIILTIILPNGLMLINLILAGIFLAWIIYVLVDYIKTGNYGSTFAYVFSIISLVLSYVVLLIAFVAVFIYCVMGTKALSVISGEIPDVGQAFGLSIFIFGLFILIWGYVTFLMHLYFTVIKNKREEMNRMAKDESLDVESQEATYKSNLDESQNRKANLV